VASAHYPPNFTSGGTLQPRRLARGLRDRGHDVSVFAGWLGDRAPLSTWDDVDETGLPIRWIATTPWTAWDDPRNFDNPDVTAAFAAHLAEARPEIVHLHSIQTLGVGLLEAARDAGARVVVTMHDFWWTCQRQFLVDRDFHPCSEVVDLGGCACEQGRPALERRNARLAEALGAADLVLAPSRSAAALLVANGVADGRVEVDENGMDEVPVRPLHRPGDGLRFLFTGGPDPMKGWPVLRQAAAQLAGVGGWTLDAYGFGPEHEDELPAGAPVVLHPAYAPEDADAVFGAADVLVIPSVMRESHSLVTREALRRGLPVVTSACVGPEEVVEDGVNGLVVPADDPTSLARAMEQLAGDVDRLDAMAVAAVTVPIRTIEDQVLGLESRYRSLVAEPPARAVPEPSSVRLVLFVAGIEGAPLRYRVRLPAEALADLGVASEVRHFFDPDLPRLAALADAVVLYRVPATTHVLATIDAAHTSGAPVLFDADDLIFAPDVADQIPALHILPEHDAALWLEGVHRYRTTLEHCDGFIGSTRALADAAHERTGLPAWCFPNGIGKVLARRADAARRAPRPEGPPRIGYLSGTDTHDLDWAHVAPAIAAVLERHPTARLQLVGHLPDDLGLAAFADRVDRLPFTHWLELPRLLRSLDVNLAPLAPGSVFNEAKSAIKWLEAALVGTPTVASPTEPHVTAIDHGRTGLLADDPQEWAAAIDALLADQLRRARMGDAAHRAALLDLSPAVQGRRYLEILATAVARGPDLRPRRHEGTVVEEAPRPFVLEPYGDLDATAAERRRRSELRWRHVLEVGRRTRASLRDDGLPRTAGRAARRLLRVARPGRPR
jgi:glycosyltransferase involved in cell wall biosynthesis